MGPQTQMYLKSWFLTVNKKNNMLLDQSSIFLSLNNWIKDPLLIVISISPHVTSMRLLLCSNCKSSATSRENVFLFPGRKSILGPNTGILKSLTLTFGLSVLGWLSTFSMAVRVSNPPTTLHKRPQCILHLLRALHASKTNHPGFCWVPHTNVSNCHKQKHTAAVNNRIDHWCTY